MQQLCPELEQDETNGCQHGSPPNISSSDYHGMILYIVISDAYLMETCLCCNFWLIFCFVLFCFNFGLCIALTLAYILIC